MKRRVPIITTLFRAELRMVLRDRRILITSIVLPFLVTPLMFLGSNWSLKKREKQLRTMAYRYAVTGPQAAQAYSLVALAKELRAREPTHPERPQVNRGGRNSDADTQAFRFERVTCTNALDALNKAEIHLVLEAENATDKKPAETTVKPAENASNTRTNSIAQTRDDDSEPSMAGIPNLRLIYRGDRDESASAMFQMQSGLREARRALREDLLKTRGFPLTAKQVAVTEGKDLASQQQVAGLTLGKALALLLLLFILPSGAVVAMDSLAGEKERGTLETLLTTAVSRGDILAAKALVIVAIALVITLIQTVNLLLYAGLKLIPVPAGLAAAVSPSIALLLFVLFLPMAALAANVLLLVSGYARTYKEAQMYFLPVLLIGLLPTMVPFVPGISLRSVMVLVPVANLALAAKEILTGSFDWPLIIAAWLITGATAVWLTHLGLRVLSAERLIVATETDAAEFQGGAALFERRVGVWFAMLWAVLLIVSNYMEKTDLRVQIVVNLLVLFFGASVVMLRRYGLQPKVALALRAPRPAVWLGVLAAVPGGFLSALGLFRLSNLILPVSTKITEAFNEAVFPRGIPMVQLVFFLTVMPGIFEEIAFRGLLLYGLHRRLRPAMVALVVGIAFGIFHVTLFRFVPTACLGMMFAAVTLLTGSIFPSMLWHALSNGLGILAYKLQIPETELTPTCYAAGAGLLAVAFWIFWRNRTPYPGLYFRNRSRMR